MPKKKPIEALALKLVYAHNDENQYQLYLKMKSTFGRKSTIKAISNAADVQMMVDPTFDRPIRIVF